MAKFNLGHWVSDLSKECMTTLLCYHILASDLLCDKIKASYCVNHQGYQSLYDVRAFEYIKGIITMCDSNKNKAYTSDSATSP